jgi:Ca2+-binding RTX toxin-like protein
MFGQLVRGGGTLDKLLDTKVTTNGSENSKPVNAPIVNSASVITNISDGVLQIKAGANTGTSTITVTVTNEHGEKDTQSFTLTRVADSQNGATYLTPTNSYRATATDTPLTFTIGAADPDGDSITYAAAIVNEDGTSATTPNGTYQITGNKITVTPNTGYTGPLYAILGARDDTHNFDTQIINITVGGKAIGATSASVQAAAGTGTPGMVIATFTGGTVANVAVDFNASFTTDAQSNKVGGVNWGDGTVTNGTIVKNVDGSYSIIGNHEYPAAGTYEIMATIRGPKGAKQIVYSTVTARDIVSLSGSTLRVYASSGNDSVGSSIKSGKLNINVNGVVKKFTPASVSRVEYYLFDGGDTAGVGGGVPATYMDGGTGDDSLTGGNGNDTLTAGAGKNTLFGGAGGDRLNGSGGRDFLYGQDGDDRLYGNGGNDFLDGGGNVDRLFGGLGDDQLFGGSSNDKLYGEAGNDTLFGQKGNDLLDGGPGTDTAGDSVGTDVKVSIP